MATDTQQVEETAKEIATSISAALHEHLEVIAYQLTRIADQLEFISGTTSYSADKGFIRVANID
jgi:hypothetical protein